MPKCFECKNLSTHLCLNCGHELCAEHAASHELAGHQTDPFSDAIRYAHDVAHDYFYNPQENHYA